MAIKNKITALAFIIFSAANIHANTPQTIDTNGLSENQITITDLSKPEQAGKTFFAATIMNAPMQKLCSTILDFPDYPSFMPNTDKTKVLYSSDDYSIVDMTLKLPLGKIKKYRLKLEPKTNQQSCQVFWKLIPWDELKPEETIADTTGYWQLTSFPSNKNKTIVEYFVYADPGPIPFGLGWIVDIMSKQSLPRTLEAVRDKVLAH